MKGYSVSFVKPNVTLEVRADQGSLDLSAPLVSSTYFPEQPWVKELGLVGKQLLELVSAGEKVDIYKVYHLVTSLEEGDIQKMTPQARELFDQLKAKIKTEQYKKNQPFRPGSPFSSR